MLTDRAFSPADLLLVKNEVFRPRRRPLLRLFLALGLGAAVLLATVIAIWLRSHIVPPDCADPDTLALVRRSLTNRFALPASVAIEHIQTHAGGYFAFRFACEADLSGIDPYALPPGTAVPGSVHYVSRLTDGGQRHEVTVSIQPLLRLERVQ